VLAIIDGNPGLLNALQSHWPGLAIQRCTAHKLWNLQSQAPVLLLFGLLRSGQINCECLMAIEI
jgi:hypothetical protein